MSRIMEGKLRLDKYLWTIRFFKTRTLATNAIGKGGVSINDLPVKASRHVVIGDVYHIKTEAGIRVVEVKALPETRKSFTEAVNYYNDLTPKETTAKKLSSSFVEYTGKRHSKQGRPTKKNRRQIEKLF